MFVYRFSWKWRNKLQGVINSITESADLIFLTGINN